MKEEIIKKHKMIKDLQSQVENFERDKILYLEDQIKLEKLYKLGIIDSSGDPIPYRQDEYEDMR